MIETAGEPGAMDQNMILETLRAHEPELRSAGVAHLRIFGSVARGKATATSDIDLVADLDQSRRVTLIQVARIQRLLAGLLGDRVDLSVTGWMREPIRQQALLEAVVAF